jgi:glycerophosphoryl diester phosphodiesterase
MNIEIKPTWGYEQETVKIVLQQLRKYWPKTKTPPLLSSFSEKVIKEIRDHDPDIALGFLIDEWFSDWELLLQKYHCQSLHVNCQWLNPERVSNIKRKGYNILSYTVNDPNFAAELFSWGIDSVFSDLPDKILSVL